MRAISRGQNDTQGHVRWWCKCDCGNEDLVLVDGYRLRNELTKSCGCLQKENGYNQLRQYNTYDFSNDYGIGYDNNDNNFYFDVDDYDKIKNYYWYKDVDDYIISKTDTKLGTIYIHRIITECPNELYVDHINGKRYINFKSNLRLATNSQNGMNKCLQSNNTSGVTGVCFNSRVNKWVSRITKNSNTYNLGYFDDFNEAVKIRKEAEEKYFGKWSYDNSRKNKGE